MKIINCGFRSLSRGNLVTWCTAKWELSNVTEVITPLAEICQPPKLGYIIVPDLRNQQEALAICSRLGGQQAVISNSAIDEKLTSIFDKYKSQCALSGSHASSGILNASRF